MTEKQARERLQQEIERLPVYQHDNVIYSRVIGDRIKDLYTLEGEKIESDEGCYYFAVHLLPIGVNLNELSEEEKNMSGSLWYVDDMGNVGQPEY